MTALSKTVMIEATRLTREGRLREAMAVLQGALRDDPSDRSNLNDDAHTSSTLDTASSTTGAIARRNTSQPSDQRSNGSDLGMKLPGAPAALRDFLDRMGKLGGAGKLDGLVGPAGGHSPSPLPPGARFEECTYANAAGSRAYKLYVPSGYNGQPVPLVVMLHGCTQSPDDFAAGTRMNDLAEEQTFLVAYPAQSQSANASKCWNWFRTNDQQRDSGEPSLIAGITRRIKSDFAVDPGRVYVAGLSAGGAAAAIMGSTYPDLYAAVGVHSGLACGAASDVPSAFAAMRNGAPPAASASRHQDGSSVAIPTIVFHGGRDTTVHPVNGEHLIAQSRAMSNLSVTVTHGRTSGGMSYTCTVQTDGSGHPMLEHWVLHDAGHAWSGGSRAGSYTEPRGPDASREMMRFFFQQPKPKAVPEA